MKLTQVVPEGRQFIAGYGAGLFRISGVVHRGSVLVFPERTLPWPVTEIEGLGVEDLAAVAEAAPPIDVLLLGCGERMQPVPRVVRESLRERGIGVDSMDTGAACRTYNVLMGEGRRVAAALIAL